MKEQNEITEAKKELMVKPNLSRLDIEYIQCEEDDSLDDFRDAVEEMICEYQVIYYTTAIQILSEEDSSLMESIALAQEFGYELENINSELLATLLIQNLMREELAEVL